jgi:putative PIN family toxin of toxin-antitoxin system
MAYKIVLDTNVLVSSLLTKGPPAAIVDFAAQGKVMPFYDTQILAEYWEVLTRPKFTFSPAQVIRLIKDLMRTGLTVEINTPSKFPTIDENDRKFHDTAKRSRAFLVTGNLKHFPKKPFIVSPAEFLKKL